MLELDKQDQQDIFAFELIVVVLTKEERNKQTNSKNMRDKSSKCFPFDCSGHQDEDDYVALGPNNGRALLKLVNN